MGLKEYHQFLAAIEPERANYTIEQALSPENITWCMDRLRVGDSWEALRRRLGFGIATEDHRWRKLRNELVRGMEAVDEDSLLDYVSDRLESVNEIQKIEQDVNKMLAKGPKSKGWASWVRLKMEIAEFKKDQSKEVQDVRLDEKRVRNIDNKFGGAHITFITNVPRPERDVIEDAVKVIKTLNGSNASKD